MRMKRGSITKDEAQLITLWVPKTLVPALDEGVRLEDSDRSKFIRAAIREKLQRAGAWKAVTETKAA